MISDESTSLWQLQHSRQGRQLRCNKKAPTGPSFVLNDKGASCHVACQGGAHSSQVHQANLHTQTNTPAGHSAQSQSLTHTDGDPGPVGSVADRVHTSVPAQMCQALYSCPLLMMPLGQQQLRLPRPGQWCRIDTLACRHARVESHPCHSSSCTMQKSESTLPGNTLCNDFFGCKMMQWFVNMRKQE